MVWERSQLLSNYYKDKIPERGNELLSVTETLGVGGGTKE